MSSHFKKALFFVSLFSMANANAADDYKTYNIDPAHSRIGFEVSHLVISSVEGNFKTYDGHFDFDEKTKKVKNAYINIDPSSIFTDEPDRDKHLKSKDFFDVENFPKMTFELEKLVENGGKLDKLYGNLNMHGIVKPVILNVDYKGTITDPWGTKKMAFTLTGTLNRQSYNLKWNKKLDGGGLVVGDEVKINIKVEANMKK